MVLNRFYLTSVARLQKVISQMWPIGSAATGLHPPLSSGLLPGTLREELLERGELTPRVLHVAELESVQELALINGLRGWRPTRWV